jgi:predicted Fe-S protein YdhL (DUF1289 family)
MDHSSGLCLGCWRTIDEIIAWRTNSDEVKKQVLASIGIRKNAIQNISSKTISKDQAI